LFDFKISNSEFYQYALECLYEAGHAATTVPVFYNHTIIEALYFDSKFDILLSKIERKTLSQASMISHLFDLDASMFTFSRNDSICFYSIVIECANSFRNQTAYDVHRILHKSWGCEYSVVIYFNNNQIMISQTDLKGEIIQSDWFFINLHNESIIKYIDIGDISMKSPKSYCADLSYAITHLNNVYEYTMKYATYEFYPANYCNSFKAQQNIDLDSCKFKEKTVNVEYSGEFKYGDDVIDRSTTTSKSYDFTDEIDLLSFNIDYEENEFDEFEDSEDVLLDSEDDDNITETIEYGHLSPDIFRDPILMVKWLEESESYEIEQN